MTGREAPDTDAEMDIPTNRGGAMTVVEDQILGEAHVSAPNHLVTGRESFLAVTEPPREIASLYFFCVLDFLIEISRSVAVDFFRRPYMYLELGEQSVAPRLARLLSRYGSDESVP